MSASEQSKPLHTAAAQLGLFTHAKPLAAPAIPGVKEENVEFVLVQMRGKGWQTARELCAHLEWSPTESNLRWFRAVANASAGKIGSGQKGYKLVAEMTREEFDHARNWLLSQSDEMKRRVIDMDRVWFARQPVEAL